MHWVIGDQLCFDWRKRSEANVQRYPARLNLLLPNLVQHRLCEMKARCGGRHRSVPVGKNSLIPFGVVPAGWTVRPRDVWRKWNLPDRIELLKDVWDSGESQMAMAFLILADN